MASSKQMTQFRGGGAGEGGGDNANLSIVSHAYVQIEPPRAHKSAKHGRWSRVENPLEALQSTT